MGKVFWGGKCMTNENKEKKIDINYISESVSANYTDGDIIVLDNIGKSIVKGSFKFEMIMMVYCTRGRLQCDFNGRSLTMGVGDVLVCLPNVTLDNFMISPDFESKIVGISYKSVQRSTQINSDLFDLMGYIHVNPVIHLDLERQELFIQYYAIIRHKINNHHGYFHKEIMHSILQCTMYELFAIISPYVEYGKDGGSLKQANLIFKRFVELLAKNNGKMRSVKSYAEELCITPKYLSSISKSVSGHTALEWIHDYTVKTIEQCLRRSNLSVKEISEMLGFPNLSFFGKFTKSHLGVSPTKYRKNQSLSERH